MYRILLIVLLLLASRATPLVVRPNVGVIFVPEQVPNMATLHWHHTVAIPLNISLYDVTNSSICSLNATGICPTLRAMHGLHSQMIKGVSDHLMSTKNQIIHLMSLPKYKRTKRGWLNIIGRGAKSMFGLATEKDVNIMNNHIAHLQSLLQSNSHDRISDVKKLHSFQIQASDRMDRMAHHLVNVDDLLINMTAKFKLLDYDTRQYFNLQALVIKQQNLLSDTFDLIAWQSHSQLRIISLIETLTVFQAILHDIPHLVHGRLTPNIISPKALTTLLESVNEELQNMNYHFSVNCDLTYFYTNSHTMITTMHDNTIYMKLKIPISTNLNKFSLYKIDVLPVPANNDQHIYTILSNAPSYLLLSDSNKTFLELSASDVSRLKQVGHPRTIVPQSVSDDICILNIFFMKDSLVTLNCKIDLLHKPIFPQNFVYTVQPNTFLIYAPQVKWTVSCPAKLDNVINHTGLFTVELQCQCKLRSADSLYTAIDIGCHNSDHIIQYSINWFMYDALYKHALPELFHTSNMHVEPIDFEVPPILLNITKLRHFETLDQASNKQALKLFNVTQSASDSDYFSWANLEMSSTDSILTIIFGIVNIILALALLYVFLQLRSIQRMLVSTALATKSCDALQLTLPPKPPVTMNPASLLPKINVSLITLLWVLFLSILFGYCFRRVCRLWLLKRKKVSRSKNTDAEHEPLYPSLHEMAEMTSLPKPSAPVHSSSSSSSSPSAIPPLNITIQN